MIKMCPLFVCVLLAFGLAGCEAEKSFKKQKIITASVQIPQTQRINKAGEPVKVFLSLLNQAHPGNKIGYRLWEYEPIICGEVPYRSAMAMETAEAAILEAQYAERPGVFKYTVNLFDKENWVPQSWTYYIVPVADGFEMLWVISVEEKGLNEYYIAQQCLRFSGKTNEPWRWAIAEAPAFSEYDLWKTQQDKNKPERSLSFVHRNGRWEAIPPVKECIICRTPLGLTMETVCSGADSAKAADMKSAFTRQGQVKFDADIDCGLTVRSDIDNKWVCAIYWERTTHISDHHPADCLHTYVNIGPVPPHSKRAVQGKIYWLKTSKDKLFARWQKDWQYLSD